MSLPERQSPKGKRVSLFVTCLVDMIYPQTGMSVVEILEHLNVAVDFPAGQTCCGQPAFNSGYQDEARQVARQFLRAFAEAEVIVTPSGSCCAMIRHEYPALFAQDDPVWKKLADRIASITWEFSEYLVDGLGISDLGLQLPTKKTFGFHDACHGLRILGLGNAARQLVAGMENAEVIEMNGCDVCCGFGGLFSVKMPNVSSAMLEQKVSGITGAEAETIITGDVSCMTQMNGGLARAQTDKRVRHLADVLADGLKGKNDGD
jgi:L-lactate dehydrogenase complex protein LldE